MSEGSHLLGGLGHYLFALAAHAPEARDLRAAGALIAAQARRNGVRVLFPHVSGACFPARSAPTADKGGDCEGVNIHASRP